MNTERIKILEELENIGYPILSKAKSMENITGVPDTYFQHLPHDIMLRLDKETAKDIPKGYFSTLAPQILQKIDALEAAKTTPVINFQQYRRRERSHVVRYLARSGVDAAVLLSLLISIKKIYFRSVENPCDTNDLACLEKQDIYEYLYDNTVTTPIQEDLPITPNLSQDSNNHVSNTTVVEEITPQEAQEILSPTEEEVLLEETINIF